MVKIKKLIVIYLASVFIVNPFSPIFTKIMVNPVYAIPNTIRFLYDGDGVRVAKIEGEKVILYGSNFEKDLSTNQLTKYYSFGTKRVAIKESNNLSFLVSDHLGSLRNLSDVTGISKAQLAYYPYGQIRTQSGIFPSRQYTSQINDDTTNLYFYNARYYNPVTANFTQADMGGNGTNKYAYVSGNPINFSDPSGNEGENTVNPENDCNTNPFSSSCITLGPIDTFTPIQATQPLTMKPCYSQEECKANQEFAIALYAFLGLTVGGGAVAEIAVPIVSSSLASLIGSGGTILTTEQLAEKVYYHYTSAKGTEGIIRDQLIKAFTRDLWTKPLSYPKAIYMTDIPPEKLQVISVGEGLVGKLRLFWTTLESLTIKPGMGAVSAEKTTNYFTIIPKDPQSIGRSLLSYLLRQRAWVKPGDLPLNDPNFTISGPFGR